MNLMKSLDEKCMEMALALAKKGGRSVAPNPMVGAVIMKGGKVIGEGYHQVFGGAHAEVNAIKSVKNKADLKDSTIYVTLEPCRHYGKTPPCMEAIKRAGITRVVAGSQDPFQTKFQNSHAVNAGQAKLEIRMDFLEGEIAKECLRLNKFFLTWIDKKRPFVTVKIAMSADGFVAGPNKEPMHFTTDAENKEVHKMRALHQVIMVGINTVLIDDPSLNVRYAEGEDPLRIILDSNFRTPMTAKVLKDDNCMIVTTSAGARSFHGGWSGIKSRKKSARLHLKNFWVSPTKKRVSLKKLLGHLAVIGINSVFVEPGPTLYKSFKREGLIDELIIYRSKKKIGKGLKIDL